MGAKSVFEKLNFKDQKEILVVNPPASFSGEVRGLRGVDVRTRVEQIQRIVFALIFVMRQAEVDRYAAAVAAKTDGDALLWFAYPKGTSKKYTCDFNRDTGWASLRKLGFDTVRQIAIDEDWSALRFRRVEFIKKS